MNDLEKSAILVSLVETLRKKGSWCGETHIQKATYFLQEMCDVNLEMDYILYKHGPYSFDLKEKIMEMRADQQLSFSPTPPYGTMYSSGPSGDSLKSEYEAVVNNYKNKIEFVANVFNNKHVTELEKLSTALYVTKEKTDNVENRALYMHELKPHIPQDSAHESIKEIDTLIQQYKSQ